MKRILCAWLFLLSMWVLIGCASEVGVTATAVAITDQPTLAATSPPAPAPTAILEPTPVPMQVEPTEAPVVPEPTLEPTLEPTSAPDEAAARLIVANYKGIFVISADGTQVSQLFADQVAIGTEAYGWQTAFSPDGRYLAFTTPADIPTTLQLLDTHTGTIERITPLFNEETEVRPEDDCLGEDNFSNRCQAAFTVGEVAWSPDGTKLAFVSAHAGSSSDVYVYELAGQQISQLTTGPTAASRLYWSPDSQTIFHYGIEFYSGAGSESIQSGWAVRADGSALVKLHDVLNSQAEIMVGWQDAETIVVYSLAPGFCGVDLRAHNVQTGTTTALWSGLFADDGVAMEPKGTLLIETTCSPEDDWDLYVRTPTGEITPVEDRQLNLPIAPQWSAALNVFYSRHAAGWQLFTMDGQVVTYADLAVNRAESVPPDAVMGREYWAWPGLRHDGVFVQLAGSADAPQMVFAGRADQLQWQPTGDRLFFVSGTNPVVLYMAQAPLFTPTAVTTNELSGAYWDVLMAWSQP